MRAYYLRCHADRTVTTAEQIEKNGKYFVKGKCQDCGSIVIAKGQIDTESDEHSAAPLFRGDTTDFGQLRVYPNRIEFMKQGFLNSKTETIPLRTVAEVSVTGFMRKLQVRTADGKRHEWTLKQPRASDQARDLIASLL